MSPAEFIPIGQAVDRLREQWGLHLDTRRLKSRVNHNLIVGFKDDFGWWVDWTTVVAHFAPLIEGAQRRYREARETPKE